MKISLIGSGPWYHPIWMGLLQAVERFRSENHEVQHLRLDHPPERIYDELTSFEPDVSITFGCQRVRLMLPFQDALKALAKKTQRAMYFNDLRTAEKAAFLEGMFDHVFLCWERDFRQPNVCQGMNFSHRLWGERMKARPWYMPQGSAEYASLQNPPEISDRGVFIGNIQHPRYHYGRPVMCKDLGFEPLNGKTRKEKSDYEEAMSRIYRENRYCLSTSPLVHGYTSVRTYKILAVGGLLLLHRFPESDRLFEHGKHCLLFRTLQEAKKLMKRYDPHPELREQIRTNGWKLQRDRHTIYHRVDNMIRTMAGKAKGFDGWLK
jgi:hypothetical protein